MSAAEARQRWREREAVARQARIAALSPPPPSLPREAVDPAASWVPLSPRSNYRAAVRHGWEARLTRAIGPRIAANGKVPNGDEAVATLALAAQSPTGDRIVWVWRWRPSTGKWQLDSVQDARTGRMMTSEEASGRLAS